MKGRSHLGSMAVVAMTMLSVTGCGASARSDPSRVDKPPLQGERRQIEVDWQGSAATRLRGSGSDTPRTHVVNRLLDDRLGLIGGPPSAVRALLGDPDDQARDGSWRYRLSVRPVGDGASCVRWLTVSFERPRAQREVGGLDMGPEACPEGVEGRPLPRR
jgi:hypothetical protein